MFVRNTWIMKIFIWNTWIMKSGKYLHYMNYENIKMFICSTWIMKYLFCNARIMKMSIWTWIMKIGKYLFAINELWKNLNVCLQNMNYEHLVCITWIMKIFCLKYMNYEKIKMFVRNAWIMKIFLQYMNYENKKYFFAIHELWK